MEDVVRKAMPADYVSMYSTRALRATAARADVRTVSDKAAVDRQMSQSFLAENIDAIHNATTVSEQDAASTRSTRGGRPFGSRRPLWRTWPQGR